MMIKSDGTYFKPTFQKAPRAARYNALACRLLAINAVAKTVRLSPRSGNTLGFAVLRPEMLSLVNRLFLNEF
jgi:hypothetical protein